MAWLRVKLAAGRFMLRNRLHRRAALACAIVLTCGKALMVAVIAQGAPRTTDPSFSQAQVARGEERFKQSCAACHTTAEMTGESFTSRWKGQTAGDIFKFISGSMPEGAAGSLSAGDYAAVVAYFLSQSGFQAGEQDLPSEAAALDRIRIEAPSK
jgi:mono/diheme cytochrome c family protein